MFNPSLFLCSDRTKTWAITLVAILLGITGCAKRPSPGTAIDDCPDPAGFRSVESAIDAAFVGVVNCGWSVDRAYGRAMVVAAKHPDPGNKLRFESSLLDLENQPDPRHSGDRIVSHAEVRDFMNSYFSANGFACLPSGPSMTQVCDDRSITQILEALDDELDRKYIGLMEVQGNRELWATSQHRASQYLRMLLSGCRSSGKEPEVPELYSAITRLSAEQWNAESSQN